MTDQETYERVKEEVAREIADVQHLAIVTSEEREVAARILKKKGIRIEADDQSLPDWRNYIWTETTQAKEEMRRYQTGKIDKDEHEKQRRQIFDEEFAIYQKAQQDTLTPDSEGRVWVKVLPK